jgi:hypothetical protein
MCLQGKPFTDNDGSQWQLDRKQRQCKKCKPPKKAQTVAAATGTHAPTPVEQHGARPSFRPPIHPYLTHRPPIRPSTAREEPLGSVEYFTLYQNHGPKSQSMAGKIWAKKIHSIKLNYKTNSKTKP